MTEDTQVRHVRLRRDRRIGEAPPEPAETKRCGSCRQTLPLNRFASRPEGGQGVAGNCKECIELRYQSGTFCCNRCNRTLAGSKFCRGNGGRAIQQPCKECQSAGREAAADIRRLKAGKPPRHVLSGINEQGRTATCRQCGPVHIYGDRTTRVGWRCGRRSDEISAERYAAKAQIADKHASKRWHRIRDVRSEDMRGTCSQCGDVPVKWSRGSGYFICASPVRKRSTADKRRERRWREMYGLTPKEYERMNEQQDGLCAICGGNRVRSDSDGSLVVDHDHATGAVRALLCGTCNFGLGSFGDNPGLLRAAAAYLEACGARQEGRLF